jgi:hypothetical protein
MQRSQFKQRFKKYSVFMSGYDLLRKTIYRTRSISKQNAINLNLNVRGLAPSATLGINEKSTKLMAMGKSV